MNRKVIVEMNWYELDDLINLINHFMIDSKPTKENGDMYHEERVTLNKLNKRLIKTISKLTTTQSLEYKVRK